MLSWLMVPLVALHVPDLGADAARHRRIRRPRALRGP